MSEWLLGLKGFCETFFLVLVLTEANYLLEEVLRFKLELRKGFGKKVFAQIERYLRNESSTMERCQALAESALVFYAAALLPLLRGRALFSPSHAFWLFILIMLAVPLVRFFIQILIGQGEGEIMSLRMQERAMAGFALLLIGVVSFTMSVAADSMQEIMSLQHRGLWLIFVKPSTSFLFLNFVIVVYYLTQGGLFSKSGKREYFLEVWKTIWLLFIADIFLGGGPFLGIKVFALNGVCTLLFGGIARLREDQAERLILWEMTPLLLFFVLLTLVLVGIHP